MNDVALSADAPRAPDAVPASDAPRRKRGRPPLSAAEKAARANARPAPRKVRERVTPARPPAGASAPRDANASAPITDEKMKGLLVATHKIAAIALRAPEIALDDEEADTMADAILTCLREYNIPLTGKAAAMLGLAGACAIVYIPRAVLIKDRKLRERGDSARVVNLKQPDSAA